MGLMPTYQAPQNLPQYKKPTVDYGAAETSLRTAGANAINKSYDQTQKKINGFMGGNGLYGSSIQADTNADLGERRSYELGQNALTAKNQVYNWQREDNQYENAWNKNLMDVQVHNTDAENAFAMDKWKTHLNRDLTMLGWDRQSKEAQISRDWSAGQTATEREWQEKQDAINRQFQLDQNKYFYGGLDADGNWNPGVNYMHEDRSAARDYLYKLGLIDKEGMWKERTAEAANEATTADYANATANMFNAVSNIWAK